MLDFTSSLYLGSTHPSSALAPWEELTTGVPAALGSPPGTAAVERALAALQGCEAAVLSSSTLHLSWDLFGVLAGRPTTIHVDAGAYAIARWGVERAAARGAFAETFRHHDPDALLRSLHAAGRRGARPLVVADGFCPACGEAAPLGAYLAAARENGGLLVVDDTQALGVFGAPAPGAPYGSGGGGSLRRLGVAGPELLVIASLAKGFGAPVAVLSGARAAVATFVRESSTRVHCSPPSIVALRAAERALIDNRERGDARRRRLAANVRRFQGALRARGLTARGGLFPVQTVSPVPGIPASALHAGLAARGVRTFVVDPRCGMGARVGLVIRADHAPDHLDHAALAVIDVIDSGWRREAKAPSLRP